MIPVIRQIITTYFIIVDKILVVFFSSFKFAATFPFAVAKLTCTETLIYTNLGGITGVYAFGYFSKLLIKVWKYVKNIIIPKKKSNIQKKKIFTKRNRRLIKIKNKYGLTGIIILNPLILSIPVGSFLITRYYSHLRFRYLYLVAGIIPWSVIYTFFYGILYEKIF